MAGEVRRYILRVDLEPERAQLGGEDLLRRTAERIGGTLSRTDLEDSPAAGMMKVVRRKRLV